MMLLLLLVGPALAFQGVTRPLKSLKPPLQLKKDAFYSRAMVLYNAGEDSNSPLTAGGFNTSGEPPLEIRGFSLAKAFLFGGLFVTGASFAEFFTSGGSAGLSSLGFVYGIPILLIGCALQYAELEPVPIEYDGAADKIEAVFEEKATETLKKVRNDVTRHRYGDEAHLDSTVKALGLVPPGKPYPQLKYLQLKKEDTDALSFAMVFSSPETPFNDWNDPKRIPKYETFFGPDVSASVIKVDADKKLVAIQLTTGKQQALDLKAAKDLESSSSNKE